jgi:hypothetical protein
MGTIVALLIGLVSFLAVLASGNTGGAVIFGIVMFGMAYGAFAWRPGEQRKRQDSPDLMSANQPKLTPTEVGTVLGASLIEGRDLEALHETEASLIAGAAIPRPEYVIERFVLSACAAAHAAGSYLNPGDRRLAAAGFMEWFQRGAAQSAALQAAFQTFQTRLPVYSSAASQDQQKVHDPDELWFSQVSLAFGDALVAKARPGADAEGLCRALAIAIADAYWSAQMEVSIALFIQAGMQRDA